jgi:ribosomal protein S17E
MSYLIDNDDLKSEHVIKKFLQILKDDLDKITCDEQEKKIGSAIYDLFENYDTFFPETNNNKFNKNIILFELREMTNLSTKEIRNSIKKYKKMYFELVQELLKH